jgi:DNA primase
VLKKTGDGYRGACPFHGGKNSNFSVSAQKQFYHCFKCGESGGAISFVQKYDNLDFVEAVETIANEFGLAIEYDKSSKPVDPRFERYRDLSKKVSDFYTQQFKFSPAKDKAVAYAIFTAMERTSPAIAISCFFKHNAFSNQINNINLIGQVINKILTNIRHT